jgi:hypothetical protein
VARYGPLDFGSANAGGSPTFTRFANSDTGVAITPPSIVEDGVGLYHFDWSWSGTTATTIEFKAVLNGVELADFISTDAAATSATGVASTGPSVVAWAETAGAIVNSVAVECGLDEAVDPFASVDRSMKQLCALLVSCGQELVLMQNWPQLVRECTVTLQNGEDVYSLPDDFRSMLDQTGWSRTSQWPMLGPASPQEWQYLQAWTQSVTRVTFRMAQQQLWVNPVPSSTGEILAFEYISRNWCASSGSVTADLDRPSSSDDLILLESIMVKRLLKLKFLAAKGMDTTMAAQEWTIAYEGACSASVAAPVLRLDGRGSCERFIDGWNVSDTGYGS